MRPPSLLARQCARLLCARVYGDLLDRFLTSINSATGTRHIAHGPDINHTHRPNYTTPCRGGSIGVQQGNYGPKIQQMNLILICKL